MNEIEASAITGNAKLDMRMDQTQELTAEKVINEYSKEKLEDIIYKYGEERFAKTIAKNICLQREKNRIETTEELVEIIKSSIPRSKQNDGHPAKRTFNQMSEEEIAAIVSAMDRLEQKPKFSKIHELRNTFFNYLYHLKGEGAASYLKNRVPAYDFANHILSTSGFVAMPSFYSGRGVNTNDLNDKKLVSIFKKLLKYDVTYACHFVEFVKQMKTLGATEFITSFQDFACNGFKVDPKFLSDNNYSVDGLNPNTYNDFVCLMIGESRFATNRDYQEARSEIIKHAFLLQVNPTLEKLGFSSEKEQSQETRQSYRKVPKNPYSGK